MEAGLKEEFRKLLMNEEFVKWVKNPDSDSDEYWQKFLVEHSELQNEVKRAEYIISRLQKQNRKIDEEQIREIWDNIQIKVNGSGWKIRIQNRWIIAASIVLVLGVGGIIWSLMKSDFAIDYSFLIKKDSGKNDVQLILSDRSTEFIRAKKPSISYNQKGEIRIDSIALKQPFNNHEKTAEQGFNQLVVPCGKRSNLILSDGSEIFLNSGSRVVYPVTFTKGKREIFIEGEAYLKVSHHEQWPFRVVTGHLIVEVLGTEFDIKSYKDENHSSVVLVTGKVKAVVKSENILMAEGEQLTINNSSREISQKKIDVQEYVAWKDGLMYCNNEKIGSIATQLSRYYDVAIQVKDKKTEELTISGKLDLNSDFHNVLDAICFTAPVKIEELKGKIIISMK